MRPAEPTGGLFLAFEGGEGVGKSTQVELVTQWLRSRGREVVQTREPGGTPLGRELRSLVLDPVGQIAPRTEALIYAADRAQHVEMVIRPALEAGHDVVTDRYVDSTLAYQGTGRGLTVAQTRVLTDWATNGLLPDLTLLLDLDPRFGLSRAEARSAPDRLEGASFEFHQAVRDGFAALAAAEPQRYVVIDAAEEPAAVAAAVRAAVEALLP